MIRKLEIAQKTECAIKSIQCRDTIGHKTKHKDKHNKNTTQAI